MAEMIKKYTRAEWSRLQAKLPDEDKTPYEDSPEIAAPENKPEPGADLKKKNLSPQEQAYFLKQEEERLQKLLDEAKKLQQDLDAAKAEAQKKQYEATEAAKTDEQKAQEKAAQEAQTGRIPLASASGYGTTVQGNIPGEKPKEGVPPLGSASGYGTTVMGNIPGEKPTEGVMPPGAYTGYGTTQPGKNLPKPGIPNPDGASGPGASGPGFSGPGFSGPGFSGPLTNFSSGPNNSNTNFTGTGPSGPGLSGPAGSGPAGSGPSGSGPAGSGPAGSGPAGSGPAGSGPALSGPGGVEQITTNIDVLKAMLLGMGFSSNIVDSSSSYLLNLLKDGLDYDNAVSIFLNLKEYTTKDGNKLTSPFYEAYGYLNEGLARPKPPAELYNAVEGYKEVAAKYNLNSKFLSKDYLKNYVKNNVTVADLDERANTARLKAVNADPAYLDSLKRLGYITGAADLTDFFMDPNIGQETLEQRRGTAAFAAEAIKRAQQGIQFSADRFNKTAASLLGLGLSEAQIGVRAAEGFENIAQTLMPTQMLSSIYERLPASEMQSIQSELEAEQFGGTASQRRKKLKELETLAFAGEAGTNAYSLRKGSAAGQF